MSASWPDPVAAAALRSADIAARAPEIEAARRLPADLAASLSADGLMHLFLPAACGGPEVPPAHALAAIRALAQADGATGWCAMIASTSALTAAYLPPDAAARIFAPATGGPGAGGPPIVGGVYAPFGRARPDGAAGHRLTGRWPWASGSANCRWLLGGALVAPDDRQARDASAGRRPEMRLFLFPADQARLHDTWDAAGLCGTGSGDIEVADIAVPAGHSLSLTGGRPMVDTPLYAFPIFGLLALGVASVAMGIAAGALADLKALAQAKRPQGSRRSLAERPHVQAEVAACEAEWQAALALIEAVVAEAWDTAETGAGELTVDHRARLRLAAVHATGTAEAVTGRMYRLAGGNAVFRSHPLQRRLRDVNTATQHVMVTQPVLETVGRVLLGQEVDVAEL
ncbi:acyl-CoA dehydrogenase family protein [Marinibaculum pumilum]|uniref:Acyl-CoA dehydrogenase family protein n=1 Tax=Marinibaculum pumilum TaxID=1766165 RepID=A0ABV7L308_9PROT